jgi:acylphosphatase
MKKVVIRVSGRVQGVSYRAATQQQAASLGLTGYVRNLPHGGVEIVAEGPEAALTELIAWAWKGPSLARVRDVQVQMAEPSAGFSGFTIGYE